MSVIKLDLHIHTNRSGDSLIKPYDILKHVKKRGLDGIAITDHGNLDAYDAIKKEFQEAGMILIPGMEIETHIGEVIGLFIEDEICLNIMPWDVGRAANGMAHFSLNSSHVGYSSISISGMFSFRNLRPRCGTSDPSLKNFLLVIR